MDEFSIVICCFNSREHLKNTLSYLMELEVNQFNVEIIIIDNASTDDTKSYAQEVWNDVATNKFVNFRIISENLPGLNNARRKGVHESVYKYIILVDDDNWLAPDYIEKASEAFGMYPSAAVIGGLGTPFFENEIKPDWFDEYQGYYAVGKQAECDGVITKTRGYVFGASSVWKKSVLENIFKVPLLSSDRKGKKLNSGGDNELCYKAIISGYDIVYSSSLRFTHFIPSTRLNKFYIEKMLTDSAYDYVMLHGLMYQANVNSKMFNSKIKRTWFGQIIIGIKSYISGKTSFKSFLKLSFIMISLNQKYNKLF